MKRCVWILCLLILLATIPSIFVIESSAQGGPAQKTEALVPLEGLDPVLLVQGKEVQGKEKISVIRGQFQYLFVSEENKALFEKDPAQYEIQLGGTCARMGPSVGGNPNLYTVYNKHIYIFGSDHCKELFEAAPEKYLETGPEAAPATGAPEAVKRGRALIERAVEATGGAANLDGITSYQNKGAAVQNGTSGDVEIKTALTVVFPSRIHYERT